MYTKGALKGSWNYLYCYWFNSGLYIFNKSKDAAGNSSASSTTVNVLPTPAIVYCASQGNSTVDEKIAKVVLDQ
jgi:hypothetical protein